MGRRKFVSFPNSNLHRTFYSSTSSSSCLNNRSTLKDSFYLLSNSRATMHQKKISERQAVLLEAQTIGESKQGELNANRHIIVLYNPVSGSGVAKKLVNKMVEPVLRLSGCKYTIIATEYRGFAIEYMLKLDASSADGILVVGGDGLVHEVVTGFFRRPDAAEIDLPLGLVPSGTANAMAHELHAHTSKSHIAIVGRAALAAARNHMRKIDVLQSKFGDRPEDSIFALSVFGWGLAGTVAKAAEKMRWIPGQKSFRYDLAGFVSLLKDYPQCRATLEYPTENGTTQEEISITNFTATNLPYLGVHHPMTQDSAPDDGYMVVSWVPTGVSRTKIVKMGLKMKSGRFLMEHKAVRTIKVPWFNLTVADNQKTVDMLIDGDAHKPHNVTVTNLHQGLTLFAEPKDVAGPLMVKRSSHKKVLSHVSLSPTKEHSSPTPSPPNERSSLTPSLTKEITSICAGECSSQYVGYYRSSGAASPKGSRRGSPPPHAHAPTTRRSIWL